MTRQRLHRTAAFIGTTAWIAIAAPAFAAATDAAAVVGVSEDDAIVVTGQQATNTASAGTKSSVPILETPQSISVITNADIAGLGLQNLNQALRFVAGVTPEQRGASAEVYDQFKLRGFDAPIYLDGLKLFASASGYAQPQADVSRLDRIEVVKGPASVLYGQSSPGGLVAEESKLPLQRDFYGAVAGTYGNYELYRVDADVGGSGVARCGVARVRQRQRRARRADLRQAPPRDDIGRGDDRRRQRDELHAARQLFARSAQRRLCGLPGCRHADRQPGGQNLDAFLRRRARRLFQARPGVADLHLPSRFRRRLGVPLVGPLPICEEQPGHRLYRRPTRRCVQRHAERGADGLLALLLRDARAAQRLDVRQPADRHGRYRPDPPQPFVRPRPPGRALGRALRLWWRDQHRRPSIPSTERWRRRKTPIRW